MDKQTRFVVVFPFLFCPSLGFGLVFVGGGFSFALCLGILCVFCFVFSIPPSTATTGNERKHPKINKQTNKHTFSLKNDYYSNNFWQSASNLISSFCFQDITYPFINLELQPNPMALFLRIKGSGAPSLNFPHVSYSCCWTFIWNSAAWRCELTAAELTTLLLLVYVCR